MCTINTLNNYINSAHHEITFIKGRKMSEKIWVSCAVAFCARVLGALLDV